MRDLLDNVQIQTLEHDFIIPVIIGQMMQGLEPLDPMAELTLQDILAELEPDTALLCIALSSRKIAQCCAHLPGAIELEAEASRQIAYYGPLWLINAAGEIINNRQIINVLSEIPNDLKTLSNLLIGLRSQIGIKERVPGILCEIMSFQATTFKDHAFNLLRADVIDQNIRDIMSNIPDPQNSNIIPFPVYMRAQI